MRRVARALFKVDCMRVRPIEPVALAPSSVTKSQTEPMST